MTTTRRKERDFFRFDGWPPNLSLMAYSPLSLTFGKKLSEFKTNAAFFQSIIQDYILYIFFVSIYFEAKARKGFV